MIVIAKQGAKKSLPYMTAYEQGVFLFQFHGDLTYTDPFDGSVWNWTGVDNSIEEILGVTIGVARLIDVDSLNDCIVQEGSFFWDDTPGVLYIHWTGNVLDYSVGRISSAMSIKTPGFASGIHKLTNNVFDGVYYEPTLTAISGLSNSVDPTKLGLISYKDSSFTVSNQSGKYDNLKASDVVGQPVFFYLVPENATELTDDMKVSTGYYSNIDNNRNSITFSVIESRFFENKTVCPGIATKSAYASIGDLENSSIPVAWGDINRGKMLLTNIDSLTKAGAETAIFLVADPSLSSVTEITAIYDKDDNEISIDSFDLTACTVSITKPADLNPSELKKWSWKGKGYVIDGTYNNALDIIQDAFLKLANIAYLDSTFNQAEWEAAIIDNPQDVGISIQSDRGFIEQLIEPNMTSLQGTLYIEGDGRITFINRDITAPVSATIKQVTQMDEPGIKIDQTQLVSELVVGYLKNFVTGEDLLTYVNSDYKEHVNNTYFIERRDPLSPVRTILINESDVIDVSEEIMSTSADPETIVNVDNLNILDVRIFDIIGIDTGKFNAENIQYGEVLKILPDYIGERQKINMRVVKDYAS